MSGMFPTTVWSTIMAAGQADDGALQRFAERYRPVLLQFARQRGFTSEEAEDVCQDVFVRLISGGVLAKADPQRGRLRSLLLTVATRAIIDRMRRKRLPVDGSIGDPDEIALQHHTEFDHAWALHLAQAAMDRLEREESPYYTVLRDHLDGKRPDRRRLWNARRKLIALIRNEVAMTCRSHSEFEEEIAYLSRYLRPKAASDDGES